MKRIKLTPHLYLDEYIPRRLYEAYQGREHILIGLLDERLIISDEKLRKNFGPVTINNWAVGGSRQASGLRVLGSQFYSATSQHAFGRASDKNFKYATPEEVQEYAQTHWQELGIFGLELGVNWVHTDVRYSRTGLIAFKP